MEIEVLHASNWNGDDRTLCGIAEEGDFDDIAPPGICKTRADRDLSRVFGGYHALPQ